MKPRQIHRGTEITARGRSVNRSGFNEAPANSPGNRAAESADLLLSMESFNEAPANSPGNLWSHDMVDMRLILASMKPRQIHRGTICPCIALPAILKLQ